VLLLVPFRNLLLAVLQQSIDDLPSSFKPSKSAAELSARLDLVPRTKANGGEDREACGGFSICINALRLCVAEEVGHNGVLKRSNFPRSVPEEFRHMYKTQEDYEQHIAHYIGHR
jgi:hypothetical protein